MLLWANLSPCQGKVTESIPSLSGMACTAHHYVARIAAPLACGGVAIVRHPGLRVPVDKVGRILSTPSIRLDLVSCCLQNKACRGTYEHRELPTSVMVTSQTVLPQALQVVILQASPMP